MEQRYWGGGGVGDDCSIISILICLVGKETVKDVVGTCISINHL